MIDHITVRSIEGKSDICVVYESGYTRTFTHNDTLPNTVTLFMLRSDLEVTYQEVRGRRNGKNQFYIVKCEEYKRHRNERNQE